MVILDLTPRGLRSWWRRRTCRKVGHEWQWDGTLQANRCERCGQWDRIPEFEGFLFSVSPSEVPFLLRVRRDEAARIAAQPLEPTEPETHMAPRTSIDRETVWTPPEPPEVAQPPKRDSYE